MENKILEFVRDFNAGLEKSNYYNLLQYQTDGFNEGIIVPELYLWTDENTTEHAKAFSLSQLVGQLSELLEIAQPMLADEADRFFAKKRLEMIEKFDHAKMKDMRIAYCRWKISISGKYNEDIMADFLDVMKEDFEYIFEGSKLDVEY